MGWQQFLHPQLALINANGNISSTTTKFSALRPVVHVLSRAVCSFSYTKMSENGAKARAAARMSAAYKHGYPNTCSRLAPKAKSHNEIGVWCWDGDFPLNNGKTAAQLRIIPESLAREAADDGARLIRCIDGVEGQVWRNKAIVASRWWRSEPSAAEWLQFLRAAQVRVEDGFLSTPAPIDVPFRKDLPLLDLQPENLKLTLSPQRVGLVAGCGLLFLTAFETTRLVSENHAAASIRSKIDTVIQDNTTGVEARRTALAANAQVANLQAIGNPQSVVDSILAVTSEINANGTRIANLRVYDRQLQARLLSEESNSIAIPDLVEKLEKHEALTDVFVERRNDRTVNITATVVENKISTLESSD